MNLSLSKINLILIGLLVFAGLMFINNHQVSAAQSEAGSNVRINGSIYHITSNGQRRAYLSESVFLSYGYNSHDKVVEGSPEDAALTIGEPMTPRDGSVFCSNSNYDLGTCYLISNYKKAPFVSNQVMLDQGFGAIQEASADLSLIPLDEPIRNGQEAHRFGTLINSQGTIYLVGFNGLIGIPNLEILQSWGYSIYDAVLANEADLLKPQKFVLEKRFPGEPRPFEPVIPAPLQLAEEDKFVLPFAVHSQPITEGWLYSNDEREIHGVTQHGGIDFAGLLGIPVYAAADGYAVSSTHLVPLSKTYLDKPIGFGLGEFVQIWHPKQGVYTSYGHLYKADDKIPYYKPKCDSSGYCNPEIIYNDTDTIIKKGKLVKQGELLGWIGDSGLSWGYTEEPQVIRKDRKMNKSWDETHLHFEVYTRKEGTYYKGLRYDPFGIYGRLDQYTDQSYASQNSLWKVGPDQQPLLAK